MNSVFHENINSDFDKACDLASKNFSHTELIQMLNSGNIAQKQIAALKLDSISSADDGKILISNLTGCDGKIREAVAWKIFELLKNDSSIRCYLNYPEIFADATIDINANICRKAIDSAQFMIHFSDFKKIYSNKILKYINESFFELDKIIYKDKKYTINKQLFKLYWALEALKLFVDDINPEILSTIFNRAMEEKEYTIREKIAQIIKISSSTQFHAMKNELSKDENYYVRVAINS